MREILFRGKRVDNGEWVEGSLLITKFNTYIIPMFDEFVSYQKPISVDSETIGQFTGLTDKNGVKIFEGDIVSKSKKTFKANWNHLHACWGLFNNSGQSSYNILCDMYDPKGKITKCWQDSSLCIIGNIHDNPELLK